MQVIKAEKLIQEGDILPGRPQATEMHSDEFRQTIGLL
jgi:hypothetical protein